MKWGGEAGSCWEELEWEWEEETGVVDGLDVAGCARLGECADVGEE